MSKISATEAINYGWTTFKANPGFLIGLVVISWVASYIGFFLLSGIPQLAENGFVALLTLLFSYVVSFVVSIGMIKAILNLMDTGKGDFSDLYKHYGLLVNYVVATILYVIAVGIGFILLIVPGIYLLYKLSFYSYFLIDKKMSPVDSLKASYNAVNGVFLDLLIFGVLIVVLNILGAIALLVGLLITIPVTMVATTYIYRKLAAGLGGSSIPVQPATATTQPAQVVEPTPSNQTPNP